MDPWPAPDEPKPPYGRTRHPFFLHDMIHRQELAIRATVRVGRAAASEIARPESGVVFTGMGTSFHAALGGQIAARRMGGRGALVRAASAFDLLDDPALLGGIETAFVYTAGGETAVTLRALALLRERSIRTVLVTARAESPSVPLAHHTIVTQHADEASWTHSVSFSAALAATYGLFAEWSSDSDRWPQLEAEVPNAVGTALGGEPKALDLAERLGAVDRILLVGSGSAEVSAREGALKLREAAGRFVAVAGVEEILHGTLPSLDDACAVVAITGTELERRRARDALGAAEKLGARTFLLDTSGAPAEGSTWGLPAVPDIFAPLVQVIPLQLLSYWLAVSEGRNPDVMGLDDERQLAARRLFGL